MFAVCRLMRNHDRDAGLTSQVRILHLHRLIISTKRVVCAGLVLFGMIVSLDGDVMGCRLAEGEGVAQWS